MDLLSCDLAGIKKLRSGKVREVFDLGDRLLLVATDRISAFDCILPNAIPAKGAVLTQISAFWFRMLDFVPNHVIATDFEQFPPELKPFREQLAGRSMIVKKSKPLPAECVVRGYLAGSGWKDYQRDGAVCGVRLPPGLRQAERLPETIFTPSTKAEAGHDMPLTVEECRELMGGDVTGKISAWSIRLYETAREHAGKSGIIIADTKFEFGECDGEIILIDECLTPDSSRFWPASEYRVDISPPSFDKQFVRDYLETLDWDKTPPAPALPDEIVRKTAAKYREAYERLTGQALRV